MLSLGRNKHGHNNSAQLHQQSTEIRLLWGNVDPLQPYNDMAYTVKKKYPTSMKHCPSNMPCCLGTNTLAKTFLEKLKFYDGHTLALKSAIDLCNF